MVTLNVHLTLPSLFGTNSAARVWPAWSNSHTLTPFSLKSSPTVPSNVHVVEVLVSSDPSRYLVGSSDELEGFSCALVRSALKSWPFTASVILKMPGPRVLILPVMFFLLSILRFR